MAILVTCDSCGTRFRARDRHQGKEAQCPKCGHALKLEGASIPDNDVFVSYSSKDKNAADAVCVYLEKHRLRCWIAPRNILPGSDWAGSIIDAIGNSRVMVLVYSANSNQSKQVFREVERAVNKSLPVIPLRIEAVPLAKNMEYFISASHWLDAIHGPTQEHLEKLAKSVTSLIQQHHDLEVPLGEESSAEIAAPGSSMKKWLVAAIALVCLTIGAWALFSNGRHGAEAKNSRAGDGAIATTGATTRPLPGPGITNSFNMKFAYIPAGEFMMGALDGDPNADRDERPRHKVILTKPFYLATTELTIEQYRAIMNHDPAAMQDDAARRVNKRQADTSRWPVFRMTFPEVTEIVSAISNFSAEKAAGRTYRLPTEAQWEYACRAGTNNIFIGSDTLTLGQANFAGAKGQRIDAALSANVGSYPPNPWGLYDMLGNAREWCSDFKAEYPSETQIDPQGPRVGKHHVMRGGTFADPSAECRASARWRMPSDPSKDFKPRGSLRLVCTVNK